MLSLWRAIPTACIRSRQRRCSAEHAHAAPRVPPRWIRHALLLAFLAPVSAWSDTVIESATARFEIEGRDAAGASTVTLPFNWDRLLGGVTGKAHFDIAFPADPEHPPEALFIRRIGNAFEIALNGEVIARGGNFGDRFSDTSLRPQLIILPPARLGAHNRLRITIGGISGRNAGVSEISVGSLAEMRQLLQQAVRWRNTAYSTMGVISLVLGGLTWLLWLRQRERLYLYYALSELLWAAHLAGMQFEDLRIPGIMWGIVYYSCYAMASGYNAKFALELAGRHNGMWRRLQNAQVMLTVPVVLLSLLADVPVGVTLWLGLSLLLGVMAGVVVMRRALVTGLGEQRIMAAALMLTALAAVRDMVQFRILSGYGGFPILAYAWTGLGVAMAWIIADRMHRSSRAVAGMNRTLAQRLEEREAELNRLYDLRATNERRHAVIEERQRIMRDMHDGLGVQLVSAVQLLNDPAVPRAVLHEQLQDALDHLKMTVDAMQDTDGDIAMLLGALRYRLGPRLDAIGVKLLWDVRDLPPVPGWSIEKSRHLQLILYEALSNVIAHARASQAAVSAEVRQEKGAAIVIDLVDNGRGFDPAGGLGGHGLSNMRLRAESIGATLTLESSAKGTRLRLRLPLVSPSGAADLHADSQADSHVRPARAEDFQTLS